MHWWTVAIHSRSSPHTCYERSPFRYTRNCHCPQLSLRDSCLGGSWDTIRLTCTKTSPLRHESLTRGHPMGGCLAVPNRGGPVPTLPRRVSSLPGACRLPPAAIVAARGLGSEVIRGKLGGRLAPPTRCPCLVPRWHGRAAFAANPAPCVHAGPYASWSHPIFVLLLRRSPMSFANVVRQSRSPAVCGILRACARPLGV